MRRSRPRGEQSLRGAPTQIPAGQWAKRARATSVVSTEVKLKMGSPIHCRRRRQESLI
jgi:hypothetical protein